MPGEFGAAHRQEMLLFSVRFTSKPCGSSGGGETDSQLRTFSPRFFSPCCSMTFESDDKRESNDGVARVVENVNEKVSRAFID